MKLFLIRHGQSTNNALTDWTHPLLTAKGEQQAGHAAVHVAGGRHIATPPSDATRPALDQLYCSPMIRAMQTADAISRTVGVVAARVAQALRERAGEDVRIGIVTHGDFMSALLNALGERPVGAGIFYEHKNTGITCVELAPLGARLRYLNRADHLPAELDI